MLMKAYKTYLAELIATFGLVFIGAGAVLADVGIVGVALAHGLVLMCMIYAIAHISGGHVNPAVTIGLWITKKISTVRAAGYIISQLLGATIAALLLKVIFTASSSNLGVPTLSGVGFGTGILIETILTFFLVFVVFGVAVDKRAPKGLYGLAIGLVLTFDIFMGGALTGAAMNPARAFGPALVSGLWTNHLVYWIGPLIGGIIAAVLYSTLLLKDD